MFPEMWVNRLMVHHDMIPKISHREDPHNVNKYNEFSTLGFRMLQKPFSKHAWNQEQDQDENVPNARGVRVHSTPKHKLSKTKRDIHDQTTRSSKLIQAPPQNIRNDSLNG